MITGKLSNGFKYEVDEEAITSVEFRELIAGTMSKDNQEKIVANSKLLEFLIGEDKKNELYALIRKKLGKKYTPVEEVDKCTIEIMKAVEEQNIQAKNSESSPK